MSFSDALILLAIGPRTEADREKLGQGLARLMAEDPALRVRTVPATGEVVIGALSELHLEIIVDRLRREFGVEAFVGRPLIAYKEAFTRQADGEMKYIGPGGGGHYGHVKIHLYPGETGTGFIFENELMQGAIPAQFITPIREGIEEALGRGVLAGHPVGDVRIELYDGSYHDVDSSAMAFRLAAAMAFLDAAKHAGPVLLEPVMRVEVVVDEDYADDVLGNLAGRRGLIQSREGRGDVEIINARVPLSEMFGYETDLRSRTRGRGRYSMALDRSAVSGR